MTPPAPGCCPFCSRCGFRSGLFNCFWCLIRSDKKILSMKPAALTRLCDLPPVDGHRWKLWSLTILKSPQLLHSTLKGSFCRSVVDVRRRWGVVSHSPALGRHLAIPVTLLVYVQEPGQAALRDLREGTSATCLVAQGRTHGTCQKQLKPCSAARPPRHPIRRQLNFSLVNPERLALKIVRDGCKWMDALLAFLCRDASRHLGHLVCLLLRPLHPTMASL